MSDLYRRRPEASGAGVIKGERAGQSFKSQQDIEDEEDWSAYKAKNKLSFAAQRKQHAAPYAAFRASRKLQREADAAARAKTIREVKP
jgi:hypothetical protein